MISTIKQYLHAVILLSVFILLPTVVNAGVTYQPLVGIPGVDNAASNFDQYINQLYFISISIAALLAVIKIIIGGVKWMLTDVVTQKSDAKNDIRSALLGLLLIIAAVLILGTINPQLTNLDVLQRAQPVPLGQPSTGSGPAGGRNNGTNPQWVAEQRERCQSCGGTWQEPTTLFRNGSCSMPRGVSCPRPNSPAPQNPAQPPPNEPDPGFVPPGA
jgi:hypothetical protein